MTPIKNCIANKDTTKNPIWLMRQAGRYLPEFRKIRKENQDFIKLCLNSNLASEITLQPIKRFGFDGAVIFSDILILPYGVGQIVEFEKSHNVLVADISHYFTIEESTNSVLSLAGKNNRFSLVGLSMGGIISMEVARRISTKISNLILISTTPFSEKKQVKEKRKILIDQVKNGHLVEVMSRHYIQRYFYQHRNKTQLEQLCLAMAQDLGSEAFIRQSEALMNRPCQTGGLGTLKCKTLILCGH